MGSGEGQYKNINKILDFVTPVVPPMCAEACFIWTVLRLVKSVDLTPSSDRQGKDNDNGTIDIVQPSFRPRQVENATRRGGKLTE